MIIIIKKINLILVETKTRNVSQQLINIKTKQKKRKPKNTINAQ